MCGRWCCLQPAVGRQDTEEGARPLVPREECQHRGTAGDVILDKWHARGSSRFPPDFAVVNESMPIYSALPSPAAVLSIAVSLTGGARSVIWSNGSRRRRKRRRRRGRVDSGGGKEELPVRCRAPHPLTLVWQPALPSLNLRHAADA